MIDMTGWQPQLTLPVSPARDHIRGPVAAPVTLVEYGDYECPYCAAAHAVVNAVHAQLGTSLRFVFRHFPLTTVHPHAAEAAEAAEAVGAQGKFWPMHDTLYANQPRLEAPFLLAYAEAIGVHTPRVAADLAEHVHAARVREDFMSGVRSGVNGTPSFFINGVRYDGSWEAPSLLAALQQVA
jgi:protein-disulfide isomerase